ncbi:MAG: endonuclease [Spirochaetaceae bacterium]|nr:MAG: endonuclease [Spirochaetaceae bacterium]
MEYRVAFWNLENLFAPEGHPGREPWIARAVARDLAGWTPRLFERKADQLAVGIASIGATQGGQPEDAAGPDLLGFCEVENRYAVDALLSALSHRVPGRDYRAVHVDATRDRRGIDTGFIYDASRLDPIPTELFSHFVMRRTGTRDITQQTFTTRSGNQIVAFANHWPSRSGGHHESSGFRATAGETLGYWHERVREQKGRDVAVVAIGDFNDDPGDASLCVHARATRERDDVEGATSARFYNVSWNYLRQRATSASGRERTLYGTLYFRGNGHVLDQILVSRGLLTGSGPLRVLEHSARIEAPAAMVHRSKNHGPIRFGLPRGKPASVDPDGFSDHFPVSVVVEER